MTYETSIEMIFVHGPYFMISFIMALFWAISLRLKNKVTSGILLCYSLFYICFQVYFMWFLSRNIGVYNVEIFIFAGIIAFSWGDIIMREKINKNNNTMILCIGILYGIIIIMNIFISLNPFILIMGVMFEVMLRNFRKTIAKY